MAVLTWSYQDLVHSGALLPQMVWGLDGGDQETSAIPGKALYYHHHASTAMMLIGEESWVLKNACNTKAKPLANL